MKFMSLSNGFFAKRRTRNSYQVPKACMAKQASPQWPVLLSAFLLLLAFLFAITWCKYLSSSKYHIRFSSDEKKIYASNPGGLRGREGWRRTKWNLSCRHHLFLKERLVFQRKSSQKIWRRKKSQWQRANSSICLSWKPPQIFPVQKKSHEMSQCAVFSSLVKNEISLVLIFFW